MQPTAEQQRALDEIESFLNDPAKEAISLTGVAGSGKSTCLGFLAPLLDQRVTIYTAMTGKAAQRLRDVIGKPAKTLHSTLYKKPLVDWKTISFKDINDPPGDILVVDESSMMTPKVYDSLREWMRQGVKVILVGDFFQLPPILDAAEARDFGRDYSVFNKVKGPILTTVMRSGDDIIDVASELRIKNFFPRQSRGTYEFVVASDPARYAVDSFIDDPDDHALITWKNTVRMHANRMVRHAWEIDDAVLAKGEPLLICKGGQQFGQQFLNGEIGEVDSVGMPRTIGPIQANWLRLVGREGQLLASLQGGKEPMDGESPYLPDRDQWMKYRKEREAAKLPEPIPVTYGYCLTTHRAMGSEFRRVTFFINRDDLVGNILMEKTTLPNGAKVSFGVRLVYTAITRAKGRVTIVLDK